MTQKPKTATAVACANIALLKYWSTRDNVLNLPSVGSISLTLDALKTQTRISFNPNLVKDILTINNKKVPLAQEKRTGEFLDIIRRKSGFQLYAEIVSSNNFPTGAGLASSASGFAALCMATTHALDLGFNKRKLSELSRRGSGSAARSIYGGFVEMVRGKDLSGQEDVALQLAPPNYWDIRLLVLITSIKEKKIGSTEAMNITAKTSPYYQNWINNSDRDLEEMKDAIRKKDFEKLGDLTEFSALKMHALTLSARPPILYWNSKTIELIEEVKKIRRSGIPAFFTIDAGPQVKVITLPDHIEALKTHFESIKGIEKIMESKLGPDAKLIGEIN